MKTNRGSILGVLLLIIAIVALLSYLGVDPQGIKNIFGNLWSFIREPALLMWESFKTYVLAPLQLLLQKLAQPR